jgi:hypothetical protein
MNIKHIIFPLSSDPLPIGLHSAGHGQVNGVGNAKTPFALLLRDVLREAEQGADIQDRSTPLDRNTVQELILKIGERMNDRLLSLVAGEQNYNGRGPFFPERSYSAVEASSESAASKNRQKRPKSDGISKTDELDRIIGQAAEAYGVDRELILSVVSVESGFDVRSTSPRGAKGLMQLMPETARELGVQNSYDPVENIMGGTRYLKGLLERYQGDMRLALAAYNWGMGNVERNPEKLPRETASYIFRVLRHYSEAKAGGVFSG